MSKDPKVLLQYIFESIDALQTYLVSIDEARFLNSMEKQDAVEHRLQTIGQAVAQLSQFIKDQNPQIQWAKIAGLRNRLVHEYLDIDHLLIWNIVNRSLPEFKEQIKKLLSNQSDQK